MGEYTIYPNILWSVGNVQEISKKRGPTVQFLKSHWKLKAIVYECSEGKKVQVFLKRDAPPEYDIDTCFYTVTSAHINDRIKYLKQFVIIPTSTSTKVCIWETYLHEMIKFNEDFKNHVEVFITFEPGEDWKNYQEFNENVKYAENVSYALPVLCQDFEKLLTEGAYADVILKCEGKEFRVHKAILSIRSQGFKSILKDIDCQGSVNNSIHTINVDDIAADVLMHVLRYIYLGEMPKDSLAISQQIYHAIQNYKVGCWSSSDY